MRRTTSTRSILQVIGCLAALLLLASATARADRISLDISGAAEPEEGGITAVVGLSNYGDESAHRLQVQLSLQNHSTQTEIMPELAPGDHYDPMFRIEGMVLPPGDYPMRVKTTYHDAKGYPFSLPFVTLVRIGEPGESTEPPFELAASDLRFTETGTLKITVINPSADPLTIGLELEIPNEFESDKADGTVLTIPPGDTALHVFALRNVGALRGSSYKAYVIAKTTDNGIPKAAVASALLTIPEPWYRRPPPAWAMAGWTLVALFVFALLQTRFASGILPEVQKRQRGIGRAFTLLTFAGIYTFLLCCLPLTLIFTDTMTVGGDTPAHNYMASHLAQTLFHEGRLVSWGDGWWCGFPMFQYYFVWPYLLIALLNLVLPFNIAFKLISVGGILITPLCAWAAAGRARLPKPIPLLSAVATLPLLFDASNTMFGVNMFSTLAGMISNSWSFPMMLLFLASFWRDLDEGRFRSRTVLLLVAVISSHFFTSIMAGLVVLVMPLLRPRSGWKKAVQVAVVEGGLGLFCMAWWWFPLMTKTGYAVDFGTNWSLSFLRVAQPMIIALSPLALLGGWLSWRKRIRFAGVPAFLLALACLLFAFGYDFVSPVFVNIRLWPFIIYSLLALSAIGIGLAVASCRLPELVPVGLLSLVLLIGVGYPPNVRSWAEFNYKGLQQHKGWPIFEQLVTPLRGTPGRLANDLHPDHELRMGSSRIFECVPHLIGKPILEGGIVNSAAGSLFSYYIQGETSQNCAGFPTMVEPTTFNISNATRHLELMNVKHFIARWETTREAMNASPAWRRLDGVDDWELFELTTHEGQYVKVLPYRPIAVVTDNWKQRGLDWIYRAAAVDFPIILLPPGADTNEFDEVLDEQQFTAYLNSFTNAAGGYPTPVPVELEEPAVIREEVSTHRIRFTTTAVGAPHLIKVTYFPNWQVRGARKIYMVTPCFMLVYPDSETVELTYGRTAADWTGILLSAAGCLALVTLTLKWRSRSGAVR